MWTDALPVGNGRLGGMLFGDPALERLQFNEDTLWSGMPRNWNNPDASRRLPELRQLVREGNYHQADEVCKGMQGLYNESYLPAGDLHLHFPDSNGVSDYRRDLDLDTAIASVTYRANNSVFHREVFSSAVDQVIVLRLIAAGQGNLSFTASLNSPLHASTAADGQNTLRMSGKAPSHVEPDYVRSTNPVGYDDGEGKGMRYECLLRVISDGGQLTHEGNALRLTGADSATLLLAVQTGYKGFLQAPDLPADAIYTRTRTQLDAAARKPYSILRSDHVDSHRKLFRRVALDLGRSAAADLPTDERLSSFQTNEEDQQLVALYFQYGRYLLIASSRPGAQPANLQGIWNNEVRPPWSSNWTANINIQMNYWPAETCNLSECHHPLFNLVEGISQTGQVTAAVNYKAHGWVSHHNIDLWRQSAPVGDYGKGDPTWANWQMSGPWLCAHLWDHYRFTHDLAFLRKTAYPLMKGSAEFCLDWLIDDGSGHLTTCPSFSTENQFKAPGDGSASTSAGCTMDIALLRELFRNCSEASKILDLDQEFRAKLDRTRSLLPPYKIGRYGQLQEWSKDFEEPIPGQRHMSHLYPLYPGTEFTSRNMPEFWKASQVSLERRLAAGGGYTGWSRAWVICLWARLENGDKAHESVCHLLQHSTGPNLWDTHPAGNGWIFQVDGNFGGAAGIAEMLLQSHSGEIHLLPALPKAWPAGSVRGLKARGGVATDIAWADHKVTNATLRPGFNAEVRLRVPNGQQLLNASADNKNPTPKASDGTYALHLSADETYHLQFA